MFKRSVLSSSIAIAIAFSYQPLCAQESGTPKQSEPIEEIVVSGIRGSLTKALDIKREKIQIVDAIVAEDIGKFPDNNVVEALQRVTGVQVSGRGGGEVDGVTIRGLPDVATTVNGRQIFTSIRREVALADIPASLLNRVDIYKTRSADLVEGGIAGQIDIRTHRPFNFDDRKIVFAARGIHQDAAEKTDPNISLLASNRWEVGGGEFGALVNISYAETHYRDQNTTAGAFFPYFTDTLARIPTKDDAENTVWIPGQHDGLPYVEGSTLPFNGENIEYFLQRDAIFSNDLNGVRERPAANISLQWRPNDTSEYIFEAFYNGYRDESFSSLLFSFIDGTSQFRNPEFYEGTNVIKRKFVNNVSMFSSGDGNTGKTDSYVYALGGKWDLTDAMSLESEVVYQTSEYTGSFFAMRNNTTRDRMVIDYNYNNSGIPLYGFLDNPETSVDESDLTSPTGWTMADLYDNGNRDEGDAVSFTLDFDYEADWGIIKKISAGFRYDDRGAVSDFRTQTDTSCSDDGQPCLIENFPDLINISRDGFFDGRAYVPSQWLAADANYMLSNADTIRALYGLELGGSAFQPERSFDINETSFAAYLQADYSTEFFGNTLDGQVGVRFVQVDTDMNFMNNTFALDSNGQYIWEPIALDNSDTRALPNFVLRYEFADDLIGRFTYGETIRRPGFGDLNPTTSYTPSVTDTGRGSAASGNPELEPTESTNYDLSLEYYFAESSSIYGVLFKRDVSGFVYSTGQGINVENNPDPDLDGEYVLTRPQNSSDGTLEGFELGLVYFPDNLPDLLQGFGIQASYTWLDSEQDYPITDEDGEVIGYGTTPLFFVSDTSYSVVLAYEKEKFDARLSYVWRDDFLEAYEARLFANPLSINAKPEASMDFQLSYNATDNLVITFDATNLTDEIYQSYYGSSPELFNFRSSLYSRTYAIGLRYSM